MDKIDKFLRKISKKDREKINDLVFKIINRDFSGLDYKKLKGYSNIYRIRKGNIRIIFTINEDEIVNIISIDRKQEEEGYI